MRGKSNQITLVTFPTYYYLVRCLTCVKINRKITDQMNFNRLKILTINRLINR